MATIHVNTEEMRQLGGSFDWWSNNLRDNMLTALRQLTGQLETDWQGMSRQTYDQMIQEWQSRAVALIDSAHQLSQHMYHTADMFESADRS